MRPHPDENPKARVHGVLSVGAAVSTKPPSHCHDRKSRLRITTAPPAEWSIADKNHTSESLEEATAPRSVCAVQRDHLRTVPVILAIRTYTCSQRYDQMVGYYEGSSFSYECKPSYNFTFNDNFF